ncbi:MAG: type IV pilus secretin PilQ [Vicinamibacterales bacterium]
MTVRSRPAILSALMALGVTVSLMASGAGTDAAHLKVIGSRVDDRIGVITIEASDPVPYVTSQPDPRTFVVELRDVFALGFADNFKADPRNPVSNVEVESSRADDGAMVARVRMTLAQPMRPRVRSARNVIYVEADRLDRSGASGLISGVGPASAIRDLRVTRRGDATAITLLGTGRLVASGIEESKDGPPRLYIYLPNVTSALPTTTPVDRGPVERVRIGIDARSPLVTRVAMDLSRRAAYRVEPSQDGQDLTVVFDEPVQDAMAALTNPSLTKVGSRTVALSPAQGPVPAPRAPPVLAAAQAQAPAPVLQAQAPPTQVAPAQPAPGASPRFTGFPVSLDFQGADLRAVLRTFAEISSLNVVIDQTIQGTVDVSLRDVPWDQALDIILRANKLGYAVDGNIVRVVPLTVLADEEAQRVKLADAQALSGDLQILTLSLSYAKAEDLRPLLTTTVLSSRGSIQTDTRTNTIIVNDLADRLQKARNLIATLDSPQPQVEIEARIVQTTREFARTVGVQWGYNGRANAAIGNTLPLAFPNNGSINGRALEGGNTAVNLGANAATSAIGVALGSINGALNLDVALSALEKSGQGRILSTPRVSTQNNVAAEITQGVQIPIQTVANNTVTVTFKDAALTLKVTPQITAANTVIMQIAVENATADNANKVNGIPPINTQRAITQVLVGDGETTVIGGIYVSEDTSKQDRTPGLYRLPLLGWLFKRDDITDASRELLIFITPKIFKL